MTAESRPPATALATPGAQSQAGPSTDPDGARPGDLSREGDLLGLVNDIGKWLGASSAPYDVIAAQERVAEQVATLQAALREIADTPLPSSTWSVGAVHEEMTGIAREALESVDDPDA